MTLLKTIIRMTGWIVLVLLTLAILAASPVLGIVFLPLAARVMETVRRRRGGIVLTYLEQAVRLNLPLPRMLYAAELSERGKLAVRLREVREMISSGASVGLALDQGVPEMPTRVVRIAEAGERMGRLRSTLTRLAQEDRRLVVAEMAQPSIAGPYLLMMTMVILSVLWMVAIFVLPKYQAIFQDFRIKLPEITLWVFRFGGWIAPVALIACIIFTIAYLVARLWETMGWRHTRVGELWLWISGWVPLVGSLARSRGWADVCQLMSDGLAVSRPADEVLDEARGLRLTRTVQQRVVRWGANVKSGQSLGDSARAAGVPDLISGMLGTSTESESAAATLDFLARYYRGRFSRMLLLLRGAAMPATVLFLAVIVGAVALGLFLPMILLIGSIHPFSRGL